MNRRVSLVKNYQPVDPQGLSDLMDFDHVIHIALPGLANPSSMVAARLRAPDDLTYLLDEDGQCREGADAELVADAARQGWEFMTGYTRQHGAGSADFCMHQSEYVGGGMARDILERPGYYVTVALDGFMDEPDAESEIVGWAVLYRES